MSELIGGRPAAITRENKLQQAFSGSADAQQAKSLTLSLLLKFANAAQLQFIEESGFKLIVSSNWQYANGKEI